VHAGDISPRAGTIHPDAMRHITRGNIGDLPHGRRVDDRNHVCAGVVSVKVRVGHERVLPVRREAHCGGKELDLRSPQNGIRAGIQLPERAERRAVRYADVVTLSVGSHGNIVWPINVRRHDPQGNHAIYREART
jgi:hypothetical protein